MRRTAFLAAGLAALPLVTGFPQALRADPLPRMGTPAGAVIARKAGEEARFIEVSDWRAVDIRQDLLAGDVLRTNATGNLAILFSDRTQVRLGRNSTLVVRKVGGNGADTELSLESGQLWARAERGGEGVAVATPAATAAIRGTDWSMSVDGSGRTSLIVLEGRVELANAQGSVTVNQGEGASAAIGQAPTKTFIIDPDDREQMLIYNSLRSASAVVRASPLTARALRSQQNRIAAISPAERNAEDRVVFAEATVSFDARNAAQAVAQARSARLTPAQKARLELVEALIALGQMRDRDAARLFAAAAPRLDRQRRASALYGGYISRSLADPDHAESPPPAMGSGPQEAIARAFIASFLQDAPAAIAILREAERRYPDDPALPAVRARFATVIDDRPQTREAIDRALSLDPDETLALLARATYRLQNESDLDGALADIEHAIAVQPNSSVLWNYLGIVQETRKATREAEAAYRRSAELDPYEPSPHSNLGFLYLAQDRVAEAEKEIDRSIELDPAVSTALAARGRLKLQKGQTEEGINELLSASTANPSFTTPLLLLAAGYYDMGDRVAAEQALDNVDRLDPNDPLVSSTRTAIAIDQYESDRAIANAQEALRRVRARGGDYAALSSNQAQGSTLNAAYRLQGLNAWGRYYGESVFDPFSASALLDQYVSGSPTPFVSDFDFGGVPSEPTFNNAGFSSFFQALLLEPSVVASRTGSANIVHRPFVEGALGAGFTAPKNGDAGWKGQADLSGFTAAPFPVSFSGHVEGLENSDDRRFTGALDPVEVIGAFTLGDEDIAGSAYVAAKPTPADNLVAYVDYRDDSDNLTDGLFDYEPGIPFLIPGLTLEQQSYDRRTRDRSVSSGLGLSHTFGYRNVLSAAVFAAGLERTSAEESVAGIGVLGLPDVIIGEGEGTIDERFRQDSLSAAVSQMIGFGDLTVRLGMEGGRVGLERRRMQTLDLETTEGPDTVDDTSSKLGFLAGRAYADFVYDISPTMRAEAGAFATTLQSTEATVNGQEIEGLDRQRFEPRIGLSWEILPGQLLRVGYIAQAGAFSGGSLAPNGIVGLQPNQLPLSVTADLDTFAARWDAEWTSRFFTSLDYQHQEFGGLNITAPGTITTTDVGEGSVERVSATANIHLGGGFGLFGTAAFQESEATAPGLQGTSALPYVPDTIGRVGLTYVNPANVKATVAATRVGKRLGDLDGETLDPYWTLDAGLVWEPFDRHMTVELNGYNLLDEEFEVGDFAPGWSRTITGSLKVRF